MSDFANLKSVLKRGALVTAANWPVVIIQFIAESTFKLLLGVPVVGGALLVALALGRDVGDLPRSGARDLAGSVANALLDHPSAFASFLLSAAVVVLGGSTLVFLVKGGTVSVLVEGARAGGAIEQPPLRLEGVRRAAVFSLECFTASSRRLFSRFLRLGCLLLLAYGVSAGLLLAFLVTAYRLAESGVSIVAWTLVAALLSSALLVLVALVNLGYLLTQMVVAAEDCCVSEAIRRTATFLTRELRGITLIFVLVLAFVVLATVASMLATAGLGLVSFVPLVGLAVLPLQAAAWLVRGIVFQYIWLSALGAYASLYQPSVKVQEAGL